MIKKFFFHLTKNSLLLFLAFLSALVISGCAQTTITEGINILPTKAIEGNPSKIYAEIQPGETVTEELQITNTFKTPQNLNIKLLDGIIKQNSSPSFKLDTEEQTEFGKWGKLSETMIELQANENKIVTLTINIPKDTKQKTYFGGIQYGLTPLNNANGEKNQSVNLSLRTVKTISFKVTDAPEIIKRIDTSQTLSAEIYFYFSLISFIIALVVVSVFFLKTKNAKEHH